MQQLPVGALLFSLLPPFRQKLDRYGRNLPKAEPGSRLLDIGCGAGHFIELAQKMNWKAQGCDFDPTVVNICKEKNLDVRLGGLEAFVDSKGEFNALTLNQVLEHVIEPKTLIESCYSYLKTNGLIWIALPNPSAIGKRVFKSAWAGFHPPYHLCLPDQAVIVRWLEEAGFQGIRVIKRGPHAKHNWQASEIITNRHNLNPISKQKKLISAVYSSIISCITPNYGEETVIIAIKKPKNR